jgi:hypothetical protein
MDYTKHKAGNVGLREQINIKKRLTFTCIQHMIIIHIPAGRTLQESIHHKKHNDHSLSGNKVGGIGPCVVVDWVGKMISKVLQRSLSGHNSLNKESEHREHG